MKMNELLNQYKRIAIVGVPKAGKSTLSNQIKDRVVIHGDDYVDMKWADQPLAIIKNCGDHKTFCLEGCLAARALRKGLQVDAVIVLDTPRIQLTQPQANFGKGCMTVFGEWKQANPKTPVIYWKDND